MTLHSMRRRAMGALLSFALFFTLLFPCSVRAAESWPSDVSIQADGGIMIDADSGCVIFGKNIHQRYYPASITKILTALVVIEHCDLDDTLTFSHDAVFNVEKGSTSAGYGPGDQLTVREALYVMLLKSANEVANALAEHCAGSIDAFADMMNEKAASLGCKDSHFANPSGLNNDNHYTTPYDYALIAKAAFENPTFVEFDSTTYYELPPNSTNDQSFTVYCGHKMLKKNSGYYYPGIIGGKTGYTILAGNTLVTCAEREGLKLITVVLNGHQTHYSDTKALLDFGFANFKNVKISDSDTAFSDPSADISLSGRQDELLMLDSSRTATLPKNAQLSDAETRISYDLDDSDPRNAVARISYLYGERVIGTTWLTEAASVSVERDSSAAAGAAGGSGGFALPAFGSRPLFQDLAPWLLPVLCIVLLLIVILLLFLVFRHGRAARENSELILSETLRRYDRSNTTPEQEEVFRDTPGISEQFRYGSTPHSRRKPPHTPRFRRKG